MHSLEEQYSEFGHKRRPDCLFQGVVTAKVDILDEFLIVHMEMDLEIFLSIDDCIACIKSSSVGISHRHKDQRFYFSLKNILSFGSGY